MSLSPDNLVIDLLLKKHQQCKMQAIASVSEYTNLRFADGDQHLVEFAMRTIADEICSEIIKSKKIKYDEAKRLEKYETEYRGTLYVFSEEELKSLIVNIFRQARSIR